METLVIATAAAAGFWRTLYRGRRSNIPRESYHVGIPIHLSGSCATGARSPEVCDLDVAIFAL